MQNIHRKAARICRRGPSAVNSQTAFLLGGAAFPSRGFANRRDSKKKENFYDTLSLTPKATQSQVKTSYYELSKMYHPDVNKSKEASTKFAAISEAYETLGNVQKRKLYDRGFFNPSGTQGRYTEDPSGPAPFRDVHGFQERSKTPPRGRTNIYDFDEFYRRHYEESIQQNEHMKEMFRKANIERASAEGDRARGILVFGIAIGVILALWPFASDERRSKGHR